jgi:hypothetical protein
MGVAASSRVLGMWKAVQEELNQAHQAEVLKILTIQCPSLISI